jgi:hypothetical protein
MAGRRPCTTRIADPSTLGLSAERMRGPASRLSRRSVASPRRPRQARRGMVAGRFARAIAILLPILAPPRGWRVVAFFRLNADYRPQSGRRCFYRRQAALPAQNLPPLFRPAVRHAGCDSNRVTEDLRRINLPEIIMSSDPTTCAPRRIGADGGQQWLRDRAPLWRELGDFDLSPLDVEDVVVVLRLITPHEAMERIRSLLVEEGADLKQHLLAIAGTAIAAVIALDGTAVEVEKVAGLQECVNCALFSSRRH